MTARVIDDPSALGWEYDDETGRWTWGGSSGGGGGGGSFPEAPVDGRQYGRQNAGWTPIVGGGGGDVNLDGYATEAWVSVNYQPKGVYLVPNDLNAYATQTWTQTYVSDNYQRKGNYLTSETDPVFLASVAAGITQTDINNWNSGTGGGGGGFSGDYNDLTNKPTIPTDNKELSNGMNYATQVWVATNYVSIPTIDNYYTKTEADAKFALKGAGGSEFDGTFNGNQLNFTCSDTMTAMKISAPTCGIQMSGTGATGKYMRIWQDSWQVLKSDYSVALMSVNDSGVVTATDFTASSDRNLKDHIETAPTGVTEKLRGVTFQWKEDGRESSGVIAQELQDAGLGHLVDKGLNDALAVNYSGLVAYLIEDIKSLSARVAELEASK